MRAALLAFCTSTSTVSREAVSVLVTYSTRSRSHVLINVQANLSVHKRAHAWVSQMISHSFVSTCLLEHFDGIMQTARCSPNHRTIITSCLMIISHWIAPLLLITLCRPLLSDASLQLCQNPRKSPLWLSRWLHPSKRDSISKMGDIPDHIMQPRLLVHAIAQPQRIIKRDTSEAASYSSTRVVRNQYAHCRSSPLLAWSA